MKTIKKPSISQLLTRFDNELKNILLNDLKTMKAAKSGVLNSIKQGMDAGTLSAA
ncbi:hypothetical protein [uncultured Mucilaginibacter sp.]|uniref:hypothetical protein n=1 Tax=uncultured Mucilaginibacter sp. TaxID=797541 RepID=UPI0025E72244|nr:hypothetical protein [uncultured Mucilaginibacter sp.]